MFSENAIDEVRRFSKGRYLKLVVNVYGSHRRTLPDA